MVWCEDPQVSMPEEVFSSYPPLQSLLLPTSYATGLRQNSKNSVGASKSGPPAAFESWHETT
eukprot:2315043-Rhodomonas_salina.2